MCAVAGAVRHGRGWSLRLARRGASGREPETGKPHRSRDRDLVWWQEWFGAGGGKEGRIHPSQIGRISIISQSDDMDEVHLYDLAGERQAYFDGEVIPSPFEGWAKKLAEKYPHIQVDAR